MPHNENEQEPNWPRLDPIPIAAPAKQDVDVFIQDAYKRYLDKYKIDIIDASSTKVVSNKKPPLDNNIKKIFQQAHIALPRHVSLKYSKGKTESIEGFYWIKDKNSYNPYVEIAEHLGFIYVFKKNALFERVAITGKSSDKTTYYIDKLGSLDLGFLNKAVRKCCKAVIKNVDKSISVFGNKTAKKFMLESNKNKRSQGYEIVDIQFNVPCKKDKKERDIVILRGNKDYKFVLDDIEIIFPDMRGLNPKKVVKLKEGQQAILKNSTGLPLEKGELVTITKVKKRYDTKNILNTHIIITSNRNHKSYLVKLKQVKILE